LEIMDEFQGSLQELSRLVTTLGYNIVGTVTQKRSSNRSGSLLGEGKLRELAEWTGGNGFVSSGPEIKLSRAAQKRAYENPDLEEAIEDEPKTLGGYTSPLTEDQRESAQIVIVDSELSPSQIRNLESAVGVTVLDRTGVIIEIFNRHSNTRAARLQVEIARLTYLAPRLRETGGSEDRGTGGIGGKGAGESRLELDKRRIRDKIKELNNELQSIGDQYEVRRARREKEACVALVGYTNAGKSSLMRAMTGSEVLVANKLFATLDTTIRALYPPSQPRILISDTVGFIKKLPHDLVASFKSTLDEALNASLLLFVVDASDPSFHSQLKVTQTVLDEVGATETPRFIVLNKKDRLSESQVQSLQKEFPEAIMISTFEKQDLKMLRDILLQFFEKDMIDENIFIPYTAKGLVGEVREKMRVMDESYDEQGVTFKVRSTDSRLSKVKDKLRALEED